MEGQTYRQGATVSEQRLPEIQGASTTASPPLKNTVAQGHRNVAQGQFGAAYVHAVAAAAGLGVEWAGAVFDADGIDLSICAPAPPGRRRGHMVAVQVKTTVNEPGEEDLIIDLPQKNYNELSEQPRQVPLVLVVVSVPRDPAEWLHETEAELRARRCAYWRSLVGQPASPNAATVRVPRTALFICEALRGIMARVAAGEMP